MKERWRSIEGYGGRYDVSDLGRVRCNWALKAHLNKPRLLKLGLNASRYIRVSLSIGEKRAYKSRYVHQLVLEAFVGPRPPGYQAAHLDGDATNNHLDNLTWATPAENCCHRYIHGRSAAGERNPHTRLTFAVVRELRARKRDGVANKDLAIQFGLSRSAVSHIVCRRTWKEWFTHDMVCN